MKTIKFITTQLALIFISYGISTALYTLHIIDSIELVYIVTTALYITLFIATWLICSKLNKKGSQVNLSTYNELLDECNKLEVENAKANNKYVKMTDERNRIKFEYDKLVIKNELPFTEETVPFIATRNNVTINVHEIAKLTNGKLLHATITVGNSNYNIWIIFEGNQVISIDISDMYLSETEPFSEPIHQCKSCGSDDTRETKCYYICNVCKSRERKVE